MGKGRQQHFDILKLFAIFLVLWGHSIQYFSSSIYFENPVYMVIYSFHMPLFMVLSGYFSVSSMSLSPHTFVKKKFVQLLLPVLSWVLLGELVKFGIKLLITTRYFEKDVEELVDGIKQGIIGPYPFWFLRTCFVCFVLAYCGNLLKINKYLWMVITIFVSLFIPGFVKLSLLYPCFIFGIELKENSNIFNKIVSNYIWCFVCFFVLLFFWDKSVWTFDGKLSNIITSIIHTHTFFIIRCTYLLFSIIIGIIGSMAFIGLFVPPRIFKPEKQSKMQTICSSWGQYTLGIYIIQTIILESLLAKYIILDNMDFVLFNFIFSPIISILILVICVLIIKVIKMSPLFDFLFLGNFGRYIK